MLSFPQQGGLDFAFLFLCSPSLVFFFLTTRVVWISLALVASIFRETPQVSRRPRFLSLVLLLLLRLFFGLFLVSLSFFFLFALPAFLRGRQLRRFLCRTWCRIRSALSFLVCCLLRLFFFSLLFLLFFFSQLSFFPFTCQGRESNLCRSFFSR